MCVIRLEDVSKVRDMTVSWEKGLRRSFLKGALIMLWACAVLVGGWLALTRLVMVQIPADRVEIAVVNVTEETVEVSLKTNDGKKVSGSSCRVTADGRYYIILERGILAEENGGGENWEGQRADMERGRRTGLIPCHQSVYTPISRCFFQKTQHCLTMESSPKRSNFNSLCSTRHPGGFTDASGNSLLSRLEIFYPCLGAGWGRR